MAHLTPEAKLISQKKRPLVGQVQTTRLVEPPAFPVFPALLMVSLAAVSCQQQHLTRAPVAWRGRELHFPRAFTPSSFALRPY